METDKALVKQPVIRPAGATDVPALIGLIQRYWEFERIQGFDGVRISSLLSDVILAPNRGKIWVAQEGDQLIGYLLAVYLFSLEHGGLMAEIDEFFVLSEKRSLHIGSALLDTATTAITQRGIMHIQLQLGTRNTRGKHFYVQHGFKQLSEYTLLYKPL